MHRALDRLVAGQQHGPTAALSVGAVIARHGERPADILRRADAAMYAAKTPNRSRQTRAHSPAKEKPGAVPATRQRAAPCAFP